MSSRRKKLGVTDACWLWTGSTWRESKVVECSPAKNSVSLEYEYEIIIRYAEDEQGTKQKKKKKQKHGKQKQNQKKAHSKKTQELKERREIRKEQCWIGRDSRRIAFSAPRDIMIPPQLIGIESDEWDEDPTNVHAVWRGDLGGASYYMIDALNEFGDANGFDLLFSCLAKCDNPTQSKEAETTESETKETETQAIQRKSKIKLEGIIKILFGICNALTKTKATELIARLEIVIRDKMQDLANKIHSNQAESASAVQQILSLFSAIYSNSDNLHNMYAKEIVLAIQAQVFDVFIQLGDDGLRQVTKSTLDQVVSQSRRMLERHCEDQSEIDHKIFEFEFRMAMKYVGPQWEAERRIDSVKFFKSVCIKSMRGGKEGQSEKVDSINIDSNLIVNKIAENNLIRILLDTGVSNKYEMDVLQESFGIWKFLIRKGDYITNNHFGQIQHCMAVSFSRIDKSVSNVNDFEKVCGFVERLKTFVIKWRRQHELEAGMIRRNQASKGIKNRRDECNFDFLFRKFEEIDGQRLNWLKQLHKNKDVEISKRSDNAQHIFDRCFELLMPNLINFERDRLCLGYCIEPYFYTSNNPHTTNIGTNKVLRNVAGTCLYDQLFLSNTFYITHDSNVINMDAIGERIGYFPCVTHFGMKPMLVPMASFWAKKQSGNPGQYSFFLPMYINDTHYKLHSRKALRQCILSMYLYNDFTDFSCDPKETHNLTMDTVNAHYHPLLGLHTVANLINSLIVSIANRAQIDKLKESMVYCSNVLKALLRLHHLLLAIYFENEKVLKPIIEDQIRLFLNNDNQYNGNIRTQFDSVIGQNIPDFGIFLIYFSLLDCHTIQAVVKAAAPMTIHTEPMDPPTKAKGKGKGKGKGKAKAHSHVAAAIEDEKKNENARQSQHGQRSEWSVIGRTLLNETLTRQRNHRGLESDSFSLSLANNSLFVFCFSYFFLCQICRNISDKLGERGVSPKCRFMEYNKHGGLSCHFYVLLDKWDKFVKRTFKLDKSFFRKKRKDSQTMNAKQIDRESDSDDDDECVREAGSQAYHSYDGMDYWYGAKYGYTFDNGTVSVRNQQRGDEIICRGYHRFFKIVELEYPNANEMQQWLSACIGLANTRKYF